MNNDSWMILKNDFLKNDSWRMIREECYEKRVVCSVALIDAFATIDAFSTLWLTPTDWCLRSRLMSSIPCDSCHCVIEHVIRRSVACDWLLVRYTWSLARNTTLELFQLSFPRNTYCWFCYCSAATCWFAPMLICYLICFDSGKERDWFLIDSWLILDSEEACLWKRRYKIDCKTVVKVEIHLSRNTL